MNLLERMHPDLFRRMGTVIAQWICATLIAIAAAGCDESPALLDSDGNNPPATPSLTVTALSTTGVTLTGSAFADPDAGDTHSGSEWQMDEGGGDWSTIIATSGVTTNPAFLRSIDVPGLTPSTAYQARVRYRDNTNLWSAWSATSSFSTLGTGGTTLNITTSSLPNGTVNTPYSQTVAVTGGTGGYNWSISAGSLPTGLNIAAGTGVISGTPTAVGTFSFTVRVQSGSLIDTQALSITISTTPPTGGNPTFLFTSDWSTALGNSNAAISDGGRWDFVSADFTGRIISSAGLDFPTANVFDVYTTTTRVGWVELRRSTVPIPAVGESRYYRWYFRYAAPDNLVDPESHPVQDGGAVSQSNWRFHTINAPAACFFQDAIPAGRWCPRFDVTGSGHPFNRFHGPFLNKNQTYRIEVHMRRETTSTMSLDVRIYDSAGTLVADDASLRGGDGVTTLAQAPALNINNLSGMNVFNSGHNGFAPGTYPFPFTYSYQGAFAICTNTWCGAYTRGEGR
jgi:hypothetical protein